MCASDLAFDGHVSLHANTSGSTKHVKSSTFSCVPTTGLVAQYALHTALCTGGRGAIAKPKDLKMIYLALGVPRAELVAAHHARR